MREYWLIAAVVHNIPHNSSACVGVSGTPFFVRVDCRIVRGKINPSRGNYGQYHIKYDIQLEYTPIRKHQSSRR